MFRTKAGAGFIVDNWKLGSVEATMPKRQTLSLRVSADFKRRLFEEAKRDKRSVTNYIEVALTRLWHEEDSESLRRSKQTK